MRKFLLLTVAALLALTSNVQAQNYQEKQDTIWGSWVYREQDGNPNLTWEEKGTMRYWYEGNTLVYMARLPIGYVKCTGDFWERTIRGCNVTAKVVDAISKDTLSVTTFKLKMNKDHEQAELFKDLKITRDGWYRIELTYEPLKNTVVPYVNFLFFQRESSYPVVAPSLLSALSAYLNGYYSTDPEAPSGNTYDWCYMEVKVPSEYDRIDTYYSAMNLLGGYLGIQTALGPTYSYYDNFYHQVIFSMWDNGDVDKVKNLPDYLRSGSLDYGEGVKINRFGNEGTGTQAMMNKAVWWKCDKWVQLLFTARPEDIVVKLKDKQGNDSTSFDYQNTLVTFWYKMEDDPEWHYVATHRKSGLSDYVGGWGSFIENWSNTAGEYQRLEYFRNAYMHSVGDGKWYQRNQVYSGYYYDANRDKARVRRLDMDWGVTDKGEFYMSTGGYFREDTGYEHWITAPLSTDKTCVDTINLRGLLDRVDKAILRDKNSEISTRLSNATTLEDVKALAADLINNAGTFNNYARKDLAELITVFDNGNCTDESALRAAIGSVGTKAMPWKYGTVEQFNHLGKYRSYVLTDRHGNGTLVGTTKDGVQTLGIRGATADNALEAHKALADVTDPNNNWIFFRTAFDKEFYIYNIGMKKFLDLSQPTLLNENPASTKLDGYQSNNIGFDFVTADNDLLMLNPASDTTAVTVGSGIHRYSFDLQDNYRMTPSKELLDSISRQIDLRVNFNNYVTGISDMLALPEGVVGYIADPAERQQLEDVYKGGNITIDDIPAVEAVVQNLHPIAFEPEKSAYRLLSQAEAAAEKPYATLTTPSRINVKVKDLAEPKQVWSLVAEGNGYKVLSQGKGLLSVAEEEGKNITATDIESAAALTVKDQGGYHYSLASGPDALYGMSATSSLLTTARLTNADARWLLELAPTLQVTTNAGGVTAICVPFSMKMPEGLTAYTATEVTPEGVVSLESFTDTIPAGMPVIMIGEASTTYDVNIFPARCGAAVDGLLKGTFLTKGGLTKNGFFICDADATEACLSLSSKSSASTNSVYILKDGINDGVDKLTFEIKGATGIDGINAARKTDGRFYNLNGQRVSKNTRGVLINGGKKIIQK